MRFDVSSTIHDFAPDEWNQLVHDFPFMKWEFLSSLEKANCIGQKQGFLTQIIACRDLQNQLIGLYYGHLKNHSYGEYIFDWEWAQSYQAAGLEYYPKFTSSIPFSPVTGPKILLSKDLSSDFKLELQKKLIDYQITLHPTLNSHGLFITEAECQTYQKSEFLIRHSFQYHWHNKSYQQFSDFLNALKSRKSKAIKKERQQVHSYNLEILLVPQSEIAEKAKLFSTFYLNTIEKKGSHAYLNESFFKYLFASQAEDLLLFQARETDSQKIIAMSLYLKSRRTLYGRYWGVDPVLAQKYPLLHFEMCYYQGIDYCLENKIPLFEAGAQGEHKIPRGFIPSLTYSAHFIRHLGARAAIKRAIEHERIAIKQAIENDIFHSPYRGQI